MRMYDIIEKKKNREELSTGEIEFFVREYTKGDIPDYQAAALLMAICINGMTSEETAALTLAMASSGEKLDLSEIEGVKVDKHSSGGVGDKTSIILAPLVAACGAKVAKMSGRGLGHTGGTIDKLESIKGFNTALTPENFVKQVNEIGIALAGQTGNLAPADKKLYALRDVTATVDCIPLIASSIMSKKIASGADVIVLDVKCGSGAFMKDEESAKALANTMVAIGRRCGKEVYAVVSNMDSPLGNKIGNSLEVMEAIDTLKGNGPKDLVELVMVLGSYMLIGAKCAENEEEARKLLNEAISSGKALEKFKEWIVAQGGDAEIIDDYSKLPLAKSKCQIVASKSGYISKIDTKAVGKAVLSIGGGRETKESEIDLSVGVEIFKKTGDEVNVGDVLGVVYSDNTNGLFDARDMLVSAITVTEDMAEPEKLVKAVIK